MVVLSRYHSNKVMLFKIYTILTKIEKIFDTLFKLKKNIHTEILNKWNT